MHRVRVLIGMMGLDQHEVGAIAVSRILKDAGMEVIYAGRFNLPNTMVEAAIQEDVDVIGVSCHSWEYLYFVPELMEILATKRAEIPVVVGGSVITRADGADLTKVGVSAAFGPSATDGEIVEAIKALAARRE
ncbi:MAG: cobalamin-dependent protein [Deltaproteobacteria bacterium]|nr:cobalamin-dependent protein [Deltaproteobacteria bacterium]